MAKYSCKFITNDGEIIEETIEASDRQKALQVIRAKKFHPIEITDVNKRNLSEKNKLIGSIYRKKDGLILFTKQLSNLLMAGIQLGEALDIIIRILKPGPFKRVVNEIYDSLKGGQDFAEAISKHDEYFSDGYINMVKAGEEGGFLGLTCQRLVDNLESSNQLKSFIISSLIYPAVLLVVAIIAIIIMLTYVLPRFLLIYESYGKDLPPTTQLLMQLSNIISHYGLVILIGLIVLTFAGWSYYNSSSGKKTIHERTMKLPLVGNLITGIALTNICRSMGTMLESGVSLLKSIEISKYITSNVILQNTLKEAAIQVERGTNLSDALNNTNKIPPIVVYMIGIGEQTGKLGPMLLQIADNFEQESRKGLERFMKIFEPMVILIMGLVIGFIVISMLLPVLGLSTSVL